MAAAFDEYGATYGAEIERAISFARQDHSFFIEAKTDVLLEIAERRLGPLSSIHGLDVGCGRGDAHATIAARLGCLEGVDVSEPMLEAAAERNPAVGYHHYDGSSLPFPAGTFDLAFATCVVHHVLPADWPRFFGELSRVTRPGGIVAIAEHNPLNPLTRLVVRRVAFDADAVLLRRAMTRSLLRNAGLEVTDSRFILFSPWRVPWRDRLERLFAGLPLGAQYVVAGSKRGA